MYNKRKFNKINDKKSLRKVGKNWITVSVALLAMIGAGGAVASHPANAAQTNLTTQQANKSASAKSTQSTYADRINSDNSAIAKDSAAIKNNKNDINAENAQMSKEENTLNSDTNASVSATTLQNDKDAATWMDQIFSNSNSNSNNNAESYSATASNSGTWVKAPESRNNQERATILDNAHLTDAQAKYFIFNDTTMTPSQRNSVYASFCASAADDKIDQNAASKGASATNKKNASAYASAGQQSADESIVNSYSNSVQNSIENSLQTLDSSIANSYASKDNSNSASTYASVGKKSADTSIENSYKSSVNASVGSANDSIATSYKNSVNASVSTYNKSVAQSAAQIADDSIAAESASDELNYNKSLTPSGRSILKHEEAHYNDLIKAANEKDSLAKVHAKNATKYASAQAIHNSNVAKASAMNKRHPKATSATNNGSDSGSISSDDAFEIAFWEAVAKDEANQQAQQASASATDPRITSLEAQGVNPSVASEVVSLEGNPANSGEPTIGFDDDTVPTSPSTSSESSIATVKNVNRIKPNKTAYYYNKGMEVTNVGTKNSPAYLRVVKGIYLHKNFSFKGAYKQLHYGDVLPVVAKYNVTVRNHGRREHVERYEVRVGKRNYFVSAYKGFTENAYVSNKDFKSSKHMYVKLTKDAYLYKDKRARTLDYLDTYYAGRVMHVKRIVRVGHVNRLELENGHYITANKNYVSIVK